MRRTLICGTNWLGDTVMSMPAVEAFCRGRPPGSVRVLAKPCVAQLWALHPAGVGVVPLGPRWLDAVRDVRGLGFDEVFVLPNSFRSALIPFLAGVPRRRGARGHFRRAMLTEVCPAAAAGRHQSREYLDLLGLPGDTALPAPRLRVAPWAGTLGRLCGVGRLPADGPLAAVMPGAARGPSKRWPAERFGAVALRLARECGARVVLLGGAGDVDACRVAAEAAAAAGDRLLNLAGRTGIAELASLLSGCVVAVCNDSGGMHVAAAAGCRVVAVFGLTDPATTGPLGSGHVIVRAPLAAAGGRDIPRRSAAAEQALAGIGEDEVFAAAVRVLAGRGR
jgi:heptosyltransferase-2